MKIGIDISQIVHEGTGVGTYVAEMVRHMTELDRANTYVLFGASLRQREKIRKFYASLAKRPNITLRIFPFPPTLLDFFWNTLHFFPIEWFIGPVDIFWSSDWTQPPLRNAKGITTVHDLTILRYPGSFVRKIVAVHKRRLARAKKECSIFLCDSQATKADLMAFMHIRESAIRVVYPGFRL